MGKLTSLIIGFVAVCALTFYYLSTSYSGLVSWLGPVFGPQLIYASGFLLLFFGNPVYYPVVLISWIIIGLIVALGSRKGLRAAGAAASLFFLSLGFFGTVAASLIIPFISGSSSALSSFTSFPPPPPGTSLIDLTSAPVISGLIAMFESLLSGFGLNSLFPGSGGSSGSGTSISGAITGLPYNQIASFFLIPLIINLVVVILSAGIFGSVFRHLGGTKNRRPRVAGPAIALIIALIMLASFSLYGVYGTPGIQENQNQFESNTGHAALNVAGSLVNYYSPLASGSSGDSYYEAIASYVASSGSVYNFYTYYNAYNGTIQTSSFYNLSGVSSSAMTLLMGSADLSTFSYGNFGLGNISLLSTLTQSSLMSFIPGVVLVSIYPGSSNTTSSTFKGVLNSVDASLGIKLQKILNFDLTATGSPTYSIYIYGSENSLQSIASNYLKYTIDGFSQSGLIGVLQNGVSSGRVIPGTSVSNSDGSVLFSAFVNTADSSMIGVFGNLTGNLTQGHGKMAITGAITVKNHNFHSSSNLHTISLENTLGYSGTMNFNQNAAGSLVLLGVPDVRNSSVSGTIPENYTTYFSSAQLLSLLPFGSLNLTSLNYTPITGISASAVTSNSNWTYPRALSVKVSMSVGTSGRINVNTLVTNNDNVSVSGITLDESGFQSMYNSSVTNISVSPVFHISNLAPGSSDNLSFYFTPTGIGNYTIPSVTVSYSEYINSLGRNIVVNDTFSGTSVRVSGGNFVTVANHVEYIGLSAIGNYVSFFSYFSYSLFPGFYLFDLILVLIIVADVLIEWRAFKKSRSR